MKKFTQEGGQSHLRSAIPLEEVYHAILIQGPKFITIGWKLVDLSKIKVSIKAEFNADNLEIYKQEAIIKEEWLERL